MKKNNRKVKEKKKRSPEDIFRQFPAYKNNLDTMKLLTTSTLFQKVVKDTRDFLEIPEKGMSHDRKIVEKWTEKIMQRSDEKIESKEFNEHIQNIHKKIESKEINRRMAEKQSKLLHNKIPINYLKDAVDFIIDQFNLPLNFADDIRRYIMFNEISAPLTNFSIGPWPAGTKSISNLPYLPITIYAKLTDKELRQIKKETKSILAEKLPKYKEIKNIDQKMELDDWNRHKEKFDNVDQKSYITTAKEISKNVFNSTKHAQKVYDSIRGLRKLRKKRFGTE